jgi:Nif-specific regulatory protein
VNSARRDGPLVTVDGTTLPQSLVESELFGHERGAYTGADRRVIGKAEQAAGGTLFLDELGEIPLEVQGKLLRFLQDRVFERVGGRETIESDVRVVAATNRDLDDLVRQGRFRADLYYRVKVIEIEMPPLRARGADDVRTLAEHFVGTFVRKYAKRPMRLSRAAEAAIAAHPWPGNVRELEHAIERAVVLSDRPEIDALALALGPAPQTGVPTAGGIAIPDGLSLDDATRAYAAAVLDKHGGNRSAAARALGIGRNRLARILG